MNPHWGVPEREDPVDEALNDAEERSGRMDHVSLPDPWALMAGVSTFMVARANARHLPPSDG
jgi:hypothetical protein